MKTVINRFKRSSSGVTLVELLVSIAIISGVLVAILQFYNQAIKHNYQAQEKTSLKFLAEEEIEKLISLPYDSPSLEVFGNNQGRVYFYEKNNYLIKTHIVFLDPATGDIPERYPYNSDQDTLLKKLTISVARKDNIGGQVNFIYYKSP